MRGNGTKCEKSGVKEGVRGVRGLCVPVGAERGRLGEGAGEGLGGRIRGSLCQAEQPGATLQATGSLGGCTAGVRWGVCCSRGPWPPASDSPGALAEHQLLGTTPECLILQRRGDLHFKDTEWGMKEVGTQRNSGVGMMRGG